MNIMAFFKKMQLPASKKWYARSVLLGNPISTDQVADRIARESTVAQADVVAVLKSLSGVMGDYMSQGRSVQLDGIGTFYFSATSKSVDKPEDVSVNLIQGIKVRFRPEMSYSRTGSDGGRKVTRALTDVRLDWFDIDSLGKEAVIMDEPDDEEPEAGTTPGGGNDMEM